METFYKIIFKGRTLGEMGEDDECGYIKLYKKYSTNNVMIISSEEPEKYKIIKQRVQKYLVPENIYTVFSNSSEILGTITLNQQTTEAEIVNELFQNHYIPDTNGYRVILDNKRVKIKLNGITVLVLSKW